jgi:hypothetical protein
MEKIERAAFELWAQHNEHDSDIRTDSRVTASSFITEYHSRSMGKMVAMVESTDNGEFYFMEPSCKR